MAGVQKIMSTQNNKIISERRLGIYRCKPKFITGVFKAAGLFGRSTEILECAVENDGTVALVVKDRNLRQLKPGQSIPNVEVRPGAPPRVAKRDKLQGRNLKLVRKRSIHRYFPWEED